MNYKKTFKSIRYSCFRRVHIKFFYNSKFDFTANSLITNTVVITRVLCIVLAAFMHKLDFISETELHFAFTRGVGSVYSVDLGT